MIYIIVILSLLVITLVYGCINLYTKLNTYEEWMEFFIKESEKLYSNMKEIDNMELFEKDDQVGSIFKELLLMIEEFKEKVK